MRPFATIAFAFVACGPTTYASVEEDARSIVIDTDWTYSGTVHTGEARAERIAPASQRRVYSFFAGATAAAPIDVDFAVASADAPVRIALLAPLDANGARAVVGSAGYSEATGAPILHARLTQSGDYRIIVASFDRAYEARYALLTRCTGGACNALDALVTPRAGALVGDRMLEVRVNPALINARVELWAHGQRVGNLWTSQGVALIPLPSAERVADGDDLMVVIPGVDDGVPVRFWSLSTPGVRVDRIALSGSSLSVSGVAGFFEGQTILALRNESTGQPVAQQDLRTTLPGQEGTGLAAFDTMLAIADAPHGGDIVSVGSIETASGMPMFQRWGCFAWGTLTPAICPIRASLFSGPH